MKSCPEDVHADLVRVETSTAKFQCPPVGSLVRWRYEIPSDPQFGTLYIVVGYNNEANKFIVARPCNSLHQTKEFHVSQLEVLDEETT